MKRGSVLLGDNDRAYLESLRTLLELEGFAAHGAFSVQEALKGLESPQLDLALIDLRLTDDSSPHDLSGLEVAERAVEHGLPCIILTAYPSIEATRQALRSRQIEPPLAFDFVPKAGGPHAVLQAVESVPFLDHLTFLHISDLHFRPLGSPVPYDQERSLRALNEDLKQLRKQGDIGRIRSIIVSGDIVYKGQPLGYDAAWRFLSSLCGELGIPLDQVILVPGNHDVDRALARSEWIALPQDDQQEHPLPSKLQDYLAFTGQFYEKAVVSQDRQYRLFDFGRVVVVAMNSCHHEGNPHHLCPVCQEEHYHGWIDPGQLKRAIEELRDLLDGRDALCLAVCHHHAASSGGLPAHCRGDHLWNYEERLKFTFAEEGIQLLLHGHGHRAQLLQPITPGTPMPRVFGSGTLLLPGSAGDSEKNQYLILDIGPEPGQSRVVMRRYITSRGDRLGGWAAEHTAQVQGMVSLPGIALGRWIP